MLAILMYMVHCSCSYITLGSYVSLILHKFSSYTVVHVTYSQCVDSYGKKILRIINLLLYKWIAILIDLFQNYYFKISLIQSISSSQQLYRPLFVKCLNELKIFPLTSQLAMVVLVAICYSTALCVQEAGVLVESGDQLSGASSVTDVAMATGLLSTTSIPQTIDPQTAYAASMKVYKMIGEAIDAVKVTGLQFNFQTMALYSADTQLTSS